jgi:hypothetical protein
MQGAHQRELANPGADLRRADQCAGDDGGSLGRTCHLQKPRQLRLLLGAAIGPYVGTGGGPMGDI